MDVLAHLNYTANNKLNDSMMNLHSNINQHGIRDESDNYISGLTIAFAILVILITAGIVISVLTCRTLQRDPHVWDILYNGHQSHSSAMENLQQESEPR